MNKGRIESIIDAAILHEKETGSLRASIKSRLHKLPNVISLPRLEPEEALLDFIREYISHVPHFITAVSISAKEAGIEDYVIPFLNVANDYILSSTTGEHDAGMLPLMEQAYLSHRLIEELNDQYIVRAGIPLIPMDITKANIIVHQLLDEKLALSIDDVVEQTAEQMRSTEGVYDSEAFNRYVETRKGRGWDQVWAQWAEMTKALDVDLLFPEPSERS